MAAMVVVKSGVWLGKFGRKYRDNIPTCFFKSCKFEICLEYLFDFR